MVVTSPKKRPLGFYKSAKLESPKEFFTMEFLCFWKFCDFLTMRGFKKPSCWGLYHGIAAPGTFRTCGLCQRPTLSGGAQRFWSWVSGWVAWTHLKAIVDLALATDNIHYLIYKYIGLVGARVGFSAKTCSNGSWYLFFEVPDSARI